MGVLSEREGALELLDVRIIRLEVRSCGAARYGEVAVLESAVNQTLIALVLFVKTYGSGVGLIFLQS